MYITYEFRVMEKHASRVFGPDEGKKLGDDIFGYDIRHVVIRADDPRMERIHALQTELHSKGDTFFSGWHMVHHYSNQELEAAELLHIMLNSAFHPTGEECGTVYDESNRCPYCHAGHIQVSDLVLNLRKAPTSMGIAKTLSFDEFIVTQQVAELLIDHGMTGFELRPVRHKLRGHPPPVCFAELPSGRRLLRKAEKQEVSPDSWQFGVWIHRSGQQNLWSKAMDEHERKVGRKCRPSGTPVKTWHQLVITSKPLRVVPPTRVGNNPVDDDDAGRYRCPLGHRPGLNLLSEISVARRSWHGADLMRTDILFGHGPPAPRLVISQRLRRLLEQEQIKGWITNVVHLRPATGRRRRRQE